MSANNKFLTQYTDFEQSKPLITNPWITRDACNAYGSKSGSGKTPPQSTTDKNLDQSKVGVGRVGLTIKNMGQIQGRALARSSG